MYKKIVVLFVLSLFFAANSVNAQTEDSLTSLEVALWPEYDRPAMLVIYYIQLSPTITLPAEMRFRIPTQAGVPNAVALKQSDGTLVSTPYDQIKDGEWSEIVVEATSPELQLEYYDPGLVKDGQSRHFEYTWPGDYAVDAFKIEVQQPLNATELKIRPGSTKSRQGGDNLTYHLLDIGAIPDGQTLSVSMDYQKTDDELTASSLEVEPSIPLNDTITGRTTLSSALPIFIGLLGLLLIAGGGLWYWQSGRQKSGPRKKQHPRKLTSSEASTSTMDSEIYCHQCGKRASPGDKFCRMCGTMLRTGEK